MITKRNKKNISLLKLKKVILDLKKRKKKVALCHGVFDQIHVGHVHHLNEARKLADYVVVTITADKFVKKGPGKPYFSENNRVKMLEALKQVDYVSVNHSTDAIDLIKFLKPSFYIKGPDYKNKKRDVTGKINYEVRAAKKVGCKIIFTNEDIVYSSSSILNKNQNIFDESQKKIINTIKKNYSFAEIIKKIDNFSKLKILVIGETIIDDYVFCEGLGKSGKESVLALRKIKSERFLGGCLAIARHLNSFTKNISVISYLGENREQKNFIKSKIEKNIKLNFIYKKKSPTIIKRRYLDIIDNRKLLGIYELNDDAINLTQEQQIIKLLKKKIPQNDLILIADYGHGLISKKVANYLSKTSKFSALNAQVNSANVGFSNLKKYRNIDCLIINATELRHEMRERDGKIDILSKKLKNQIKCKSLVVTQGRAGLIMINDKNKTFTAPAFANQVVDKVGAGDALLSILAICLKDKNDENLSNFISSLVAAQSVENIGNSKPINKSSLLKNIQYILK